jgi:hypothetical protein
MGFLENLAGYYVKRSQELEQTFTAAKAKVNAGTYKLGDFFSDNLKLWSSAIDDLSALYALPGADNVPVLFTTLSPTTTQFEGLVTIARLPADVTLIPTKILPLYGTGEVAATDVTPVVQADGTLKVKIANLGALSSGGVFQGVIYFSKVGGGLQPVTLIFLFKS